MRNNSLGELCKMIIFQIQMLNLKGNQNYWLNWKNYEVSNSWKASSEQYSNSL